MVATRTDEAGHLVELGEEPESFDSWYAREHPRLFATLLLSTGDVELAAEGVDEAFTRALEKWDQVSVMESPTGWAFRVALNHARRTARRRSIERRIFVKRRRRSPSPLRPVRSGSSSPASRLDNERLSCSATSATYGKPRSPKCSVFPEAPYRAPCPTLTTDSDPPGRRTPERREAPCLNSAAWLNNCWIIPLSLLLQSPNCVVEDSADVNAGFSVDQRRC